MNERGPQYDGERPSDEMMGFIVDDLPEVKRELGREFAPSADRLGDEHLNPYYQSPGTDEQPRNVFEKIVDLKNPTEDDQN